MVCEVGERLVLPLRDTPFCIFVLPRGPGSALPLRCNPSFPDVLRCPDRLELLPPVLCVWVWATAAVVSVETIKRMAIRICFMLLSRLVYSLGKLLASLVVCETSRSSSALRNFTRTGRFHPGRYSPKLTILLS